MYIELSKASQKAEAAGSSACGNNDPANDETVPHDIMEGAIVVPSSWYVLVGPHFSSKQCVAGPDIDSQQLSRASTTSSEPVLDNDGGQDAADELMTTAIKPHRQPSLKSLLVEENEDDDEKPTPTMDVVVRDADKDSLGWIVYLIFLLSSPVRKRIVGLLYLQFRKACQMWHLKMAARLEREAPDKALEALVAKPCIQKAFSRSRFPLRRGRSSERQLQEEQPPAAAWGTGPWAWAWAAG